MQSRKNLELIQLRDAQHLSGFGRGGYFTPQFSCDAGCPCDQLGIALGALSSLVIDIVFKTDAHVAAQQDGLYDCRQLIGGDAHGGRRRVEQPEVAGVGRVHLPLPEALDDEVQRRQGIGRPEK